MNIERNTYKICALWIALVTASFLWNYKVDSNAYYRAALSASQNLFNQIVLTRKWNALHGGVYVPVSKQTTPNPYLEDPRRDLVIDKDLTLTKINPAFMTRQIAELASREHGVHFHLTSLNPIRPSNRPTPTEARILKSFSEGAKESGFFVQENSEKRFFYMAPLRTEKPCLSCHARQGYREGDIRGGISISIPFPGNTHFLLLVGAHGFFLVVGLAGIMLYGFTLKEAYKEIKNQAVFDALTGIPNRRNFSESILQEFKRSRRLKRPLAVIMCDIDNFKLYNDTYGHNAGDSCLKKVAQTIEGSLERPADFCARYGGEEFVIILPNTPLQGAHHIAERVRCAVEQLNINNEHASQKRITLSLGIAVSMELHDISSEDLVKYADKALYRAKERGKNRTESFDQIFCDDTTTST